MTQFLPAWPLLSAFLVASVVLAVTPGPGVACIVTRSIVQGRRYGLASVAGVALGSLFVAIAAVTDSICALAASTIAPLLQRSGARRIGG